jgi:pyruvate/2-oxoglutarate dehydrogenase complex dihydrolipoamide acyltransferase (E2) component
LQGATFTVSNLGALGVELFTPIINPPQVAILGICGITPKMRASEKGIEVYQSMGLSFTYDHRVIDGAPASRFVQELCRKLENFSI